MTNAKPPWEKKNPKKNTTKMKMTPAQIEEAKERAKKAGRPYPNLVDNMAVTRKNTKVSKEISGEDPEGFFPHEKGSG